LLVFTIGDGWAPLCGFLGVPVPDAPFPRLNDGDDFWSRFGGEPAEA
jgi:Sulfotransferase domain